MHTTCKHSLRNRWDAIAQGNVFARKQDGVSLLEALITLVILSVGFLASASMQVQSMRTNQDAYQRAQALVVLSNMMDHMSSNPIAVSAGLFDNTTTGFRTMPTCQATGCTDQQRAEVALFEFSASFESLRGESNFIPLLPMDSSGAPAVGSISSPEDGVYTLSVVWERLDRKKFVDEVVSVDFVP